MTRGTPVANHDPRERPGIARNPLSSEPIVDFAMRWLIDIVFALFVLAIVYMSFVPFDLTLSPPDRGWRAGRVFLGLGISPFNLPDILANIAYYVPVSTLGFFVFRRRMGSIAAMLMILVLGSALSFGVEFAQQWTVSRIPAWADFVANVIGLLVGLTLAIIVHPFVRLLARSARETLRADLPGAVAKLLVCLLLVVHVRPFDLAVDIPRTVLNTARHGNFRFNARWNDLTASTAKTSNANVLRPHIRTDRARYEYVMDQIAATAGYAALACLLMISSRRSGLESKLPVVLTFASIAWCGFVTVSLAAIVTCLRILMVSHGLDTAHLLCGIVGWPLGVTASQRFGRSTSTDLANNSTSPWTSIAWLGVAAWVLTYELIPFDFASTTLAQARALGRINLLPLRGQFAGSVPNLVADVSGKFIRYAALSACLAIPFARLARIHWKRSCLLIAFLSTAAVAIMQAIHLFQPSRICDTTNVLIAATAAFVTTVLIRGIHDVSRIAPRVVDDLLTRQLIEGESYDKNALTSLRKPRSSASPTEAAQGAPRD